MYDIEDCTRERSRMLSVVYENRKERASLERWLSNMPTGAAPRTWKSAIARENFDLKTNWLHKELSRVGTKSRSSERRLALYRTRHLIRNDFDAFMAVRNMCPDRCQITGQLLNYGLGVAGKLVNDYSLATEGVNAISPSIDRIDSDQGYFVNNIQIISSFENIGRELGADITYMQELFSTHSKRRRTVTEFFEFA